MVPDHRKHLFPSFELFSLKVSIEGNLLRPKRFQKIKNSRKKEQWKTSFLKISFLAILTQVRCPTLTQYNKNKRFFSQIFYCREIFWKWFTVKVYSREIFHKTSSAKVYSRVKISRFAGTAKVSSRESFFIIDEVSMVSNILLLSLLLSTNQRLVEIFGCNSNIPFAGLTVIFCVDIFQLPPIQVRPIYSDYNDEWQNLVHI